MQSRVRRRSTPRLDVRSLQAWTLAAAYLGGGLTCLAGAAFPMSPRAPVALGVVLGLVCLLAGAALIATRRRLPPAGLQVAALGGAVIAGVFVANSHTLAGLVVSASSLPWLGVWAAAFASPRRAIATATVATAVLALGVAASDAPGRIAAGAAVAATVWAATVAFVVVAVHVRAHLDTDPLTGLLNRAGLRRAAERVRRRADRHDETVGVAVLDLDDFKGLNDRNGHAAGDRARAELGRVWARPVGAEGLLGREGGDEFVLVVPGADRTEAQRLPVQLHAASTVRWTAGLTQWQRGEDLEACLERADHDLYRRKRDPERRAA
jgi:diguanylate cyclase (GGDEF)-like protein